MYKALLWVLRLKVHKIFCDDDMSDYKVTITKLFLW